MAKSTHFCWFYLGYFYLHDFLAPFWHRDASLKQTEFFKCSSNWNLSFHYYNKADAQTVIKASYTPCAIIKDKVEQFLTFNLQKQKNTPIHVVINI